MIRVEIELDTKVRLIRYHCLRLVLEGDDVKIYYCIDNAREYHGNEEQVLSIDRDKISVIIALQIAYPSFKTVEDVCGSDQDKLKILEDLWEHGLIITEKPLEVIED